MIRLILIFSFALAFSQIQYKNETGTLYDLSDKILFEKYKIAVSSPNWSAPIPFYRFYKNGNPKALCENLTFFLRPHNLKCSAFDSVSRQLILMPVKDSSKTQTFSPPPIPYKSPIPSLKPSILSNDTLFKTSQNYSVPVQKKEFRNVCKSLDLKIITLKASESFMFGLASKGLSLSKVLDEQIPISLDDQYSTNDFSLDTLNYSATSFCGLFTHGYNSKSFYTEIQQSEKLYISKVSEKIDTTISVNIQQNEDSTYTIKYQNWLNDGLNFTTSFRDSLLAPISANSEQKSQGGFWWFDWLFHQNKKYRYEVKIHVRIK